MRDAELESMIDDVVIKCLCGKKKAEVQTSKWLVKAYLSTSKSPRYANPLIRVEIQNLELRDYS